MSRPSDAARPRVRPLPPERRRRSVRRAVVVAATGVAAAALLVVGPAPAYAHDRLTGSTPKDGSTVTTAPTEVSLSFTDEVQEIGLTVLVKDPSGASVARGAPSIDGDTVVQGLDPLAASGVYTVAYRVVSSDGHPISGRFTFTATLPAASPVSSPSATPGSASPSASDTPGETAVAASPVSSSSDGGSGTPWLAMGLGLLAVLAAAGALVVVRRRTA